MEHHKDPSKIIIYAIVVHDRELKTWGIPGVMSPAGIPMPAFTASPDIAINMANDMRGHPDISDVVVLSYTPGDMYTVDEFISHVMGNDNDRKH